MIHSTLLSKIVQQSTIPYAMAKSVAEIGVSKIPQSRHSLFLRAFLSELDPHFFGGCWPTRSVAPAVLWRFGRGHRKVHRDLWEAGYANLVRAATILRLASSGGRENLTLPEAAIMATVPAPVVFKTSTLPITHGAYRLSVLRYIRSIATSDALEHIDWCCQVRTQLGALLYAMCIEVTLYQEVLS